MMEALKMLSEYKKHSMTCSKRLRFLAWAVEQVESIPGALVECGVWKGGNLLLMSDLSDKNIWGYDTFQGMPKPTEKDRFRGEKVQWREGWNYAELKGVRNLVPDAILVEGRVQDTIPGWVPDKISLLRLDTDFYASTKHELKHLYPLLQEGGIFITDDYGSWSGAKKACDEYGLELKQIEDTNAYWCRKN